MGPIFNTRYYDLQNPDKFNLIIEWQNLEKNELK